MAMEFTGLVYETADGKFSMKLDNLHKNTWVNAFIRQADHVFNNEVAAKVTAAKAKADGDFTEAMADEIRLTERTKHAKNMDDGTWGEKGARGPRMPAANRLEQIFNMYWAADTRQTMAKSSFKEGDAKDTWLLPDGKVVPLADWMTIFFKNPEKGADRRASVETRAKAKYEAELALAAQAKADKEREANKVVSTVEGEEVTI